MGGWVIKLCKKLAWGRKFPPLEPPRSSLLNSVVYLQYALDVLDHGDVGKEPRYGEKGDVC